MKTEFLLLPLLLSAISRFLKNTAKPTKYLAKMNIIFSFKVIFKYNELIMQVQAISMRRHKRISLFRK